MGLCLREDASPLCCLLSLPGVNFPTLSVKLNSKWEQRDWPPWISYISCLCFSERTAWVVNSSEVISKVLSSTSHNPSPPGIQELHKSTDWRESQARFPLPCPPSFRKAATFDQLADFYPQWWNRKEQNRIATTIPVTGHVGHDPVVRLRHWKIKTEDRKQKEPWGKKSPWARTHVFLAQQSLRQQTKTS